MVNINALKSMIAFRGITQKDLYTAIGLTKRQWQLRLTAKKFGSDEIKAIIKELKLSADDVMRIFFADADT